MHRRPGDAIEMNVFYLDFGSRARERKIRRRQRAVKDPETADYFCQGPTVAVTLTPYRNIVFDIHLSPWTEIEGTLQEYGSTFVNSLLDRFDILSNITLTGDGRIE
ncbi:MAG: hypothetical protein WBR24_21895 [Desulfobacterales bacterium]